ncbi:MAG: hypothetical protein KKA62_06055 [Nanoarchaeota archaeon]|nr:hypothetical protein [Nanoarchaeota archaeon]MBU1644359.1 hypothetical protein [Nanoarchaeota archaeon]MBU1977488.1 hypothetical protein [Nanoarchaeota archaeon]
MAEEELKNLSPEEKLRKLKELEKKKKEEIAEAEKQVREAEEDIKDKQKFKEKVPIEEFAKEDLEGLSAEGKEILKQKGLKEKISKNEEAGKRNQLDIIQKEYDLESLTRKEALEISPEVMASPYTTQLSKEPMGNIYEEMKDITKTVDEKGYINAEEKRRVEYLTSAVEKKIWAEEAGSYSFSEDLALAASITKQLGENLMSTYKRNKTEGLYHR